MTNNQEFGAEALKLCEHLRQLATSGASLGTATRLKSVIALMQAQHAEELAAAQGEWISVEDELPKKGGPYTAQRADGEIVTAYYEKSGWDYRAPIRWLKTPEPPPPPPIQRPLTETQAALKELHDLYEQLLNNGMVGDKFITRNRIDSLLKLHGIES